MQVRLELARTRDDKRQWVQDRRARTRQLIELGGLVQRLDWSSCSKTIAPPCSERCWAWPISLEDTGSRKRIRATLRRAGDDAECGCSRRTDRLRRRPYD